MIYAIAAVLVLIADQAVKFWTTKNILLDAAGADCVELIPGVVHMTNVHNYGAAFSILQNARWLLVAVTLIFVIAIIVLISQEIIHTGFGKWTAVLIVAGALGNCIDRILYGYVVDMFEFEFFTFPVFNVADIFITVSGILFCIHVIFHREPEEVKAANEPDFVRRRREEKAAKEAPYANIPKRGEHKSLEEELRAADPDDPFAEWGFGDIVEDRPEPEAPEEAPAPRTAKAPERRASRPAPEIPDEGGEAEEPEEEDGFSFEPVLPQRRAAAPKRKAPPAPPVPDLEPEDEKPESGDSDGGGEDDFTLEDILSEFGDL